MKMKVSKHLIRQYEKRAQHVLRGGKLNKRKMTPMFKVFFQRYMTILNKERADEITRQETPAAENNDPTSRQELAESHLEGKPAEAEV